MAKLGERLRKVEPVDLSAADPEVSGSMRPRVHHDPARSDGPAGRERGRTGSPWLGNIRSALAEGPGVTAEIAASGKRNWQAAVGAFDDAATPPLLESSEEAS